MFYFTEENNNNKNKNKNKKNCCPIEVHIFPDVLQTF